MGVSQPRISDLVRGKIGLFTIDTLANMATSAGLKVDVDVTAARPGTRKRNAA
jgi:predicted XRE-type DNA-binding protein